MKRLPLHTSIFIGMFLGVLFGVLLPQGVPYIAFIGRLFIDLLKMAAIPLILVSVMYGVATVGSIGQLSRMGIKTFAFYITTNLLAVLTSLILVNLIEPGKGVKMFGQKPASLPAAESVFDFVPSNLFQALSNGDSLQIIFVALLFGVTFVVLNGQVPTLLRSLEEANTFLFKLTGMIIQLAPLGVFALMAAMVRAMDWLTFIGIAKFALVILTGLLIHGMITLPIFFRFFSSRPLGVFALQMRPALLTAFSTSSSSATLPVTMNCIEKEAKISSEIAGFVLPVGATVNMDGTAIYEAAACLFVAQALGIELTLAQQMIVFVMAALAAIGAASIPSAGLVTLTLVLSSVGLPLDGIGFLLAIDRPLDMSRTVVNVWGDMVGCAIIEGKQKNLQKN